MFGKHEAKRQRTLAEQLQQQADAYMQQASQPTPLQSAEDKANLDLLNWENGTNGPVDIRNAPGMAGYLDLTKRAPPCRPREAR